MYSKDECKRWHALFVVTGQEDKVKERLKYKFKDRDISIVVPKRKLKERSKGAWETKVRVLFPGYVLLNGAIGADEYYSLEETPGIINILKDESGLLEIYDEEIKIISRLISGNEVIGPSVVMFDAGRIIVADGPLKGLEGLIEAVDKRKGRAKVRLNLIGNPKVVDLSISMIKTA